MQSTKQKRASQPTLDGQRQQSQGYEVGQRLAERYVLKERIGAGGMGCVWRAEHEGLGSDVALKLTSCPNGLVADRLVREAKLCARISHPGVVRVYDAGVAPHGEPFVVMELLRGIDMGRSIEMSGAMAAKTAVGLLLPVLEALGRVHDAGIVHRDIKPENVFLAEKENGRVEPKLVDFGIAWSPDVEKLTCDGDALGTPAYMSPEQAGGHEVGSASDVWSFCAVLYEAIEGSLPFEAKNALSLLVAILNDKPRVPDFAVREPELWSIIHRGLSHEPEARPTARALGGALARWLEELGVHEDVNGQPLRPTWTEHMPTSTRTSWSRISRWGHGPRRWGVAAGFALMSVTGVCLLPFAPSTASAERKRDADAVVTVVAQAMPAETPMAPPVPETQKAQEPSIPRPVGVVVAAPASPPVAAPQASPTQASPTVTAATTSAPTPPSQRDSRRPLKNPFD
jgi:eukaryotic-like serine/threonine-protein kinase